MRLIMKIIDAIVLYVLKFIAAIAAFVGAFLFVGVSFALLGWLDTVYANFLAVLIVILAFPPAVLAFARSFNSLAKEESPQPCPADRSSASLELVGGTAHFRNNSDMEAFYSQYVPFDLYYTKVVGVTFKNKDGSDRQAILSNCCKWDNLTLEPFTHRGSPAFAVWTRHGQIGNLSAEDASMIATAYSDFITLAEIKEITGGKRGQYYGCNIILTFYKKKLSEQ